jgi:hypothetical protein
LFVLGFLALILYSTLGHGKFKVQVCMAFNGQSSCKTASASSEAAAIRTATEGACADIAGGVTDTVKCQNTNPQSMRWLSRP